ncbi:ATP-dependent DNA helicase RecG [Candidatus Gottesmanbacteria bacterium]|nr:ATP-dependent DNA helicase RecG [Candidatus Gottesmanbacteria bacterium]
MELKLDTPIRYVPGVGPVMAGRLDTLGIRTVKDLLFYPPFRYDDFSLISPIARVQPGETVTVGGEITAFRNAFTKSGKKLQQAQLTDETGSIDVIWFNQPFLVRTLPVGTQARLAGKIDWFGHKIVMTSPVYEKTEGSHTSMDGSMRSFSISQTESLHTSRLVPIYPETVGVTSKWLRGRIAFILEQCITQLFEYLPDSILSTYRLMAIQKSIEQIHYPTDTTTAAAARHRLAFDEFLFLVLTALEQKRIWETTQQADSILLPSEELVSFISSLAFQLTGDQKQTVAEILNDLAKPFPMNRLLEGDVGSGKTVVAAIAMYATFRRGYQSVLMAPTQILAEQHYNTISQLFKPLGVGVGLVVSKRGLDSRRSLPRTPLRGGNDKEEKFDILVGTHALLSESINFDNVGLIVIDEQQRFGVNQRLLIREKAQTAKTPHLLTMTATPIPRTVALTVYGNLSLSVLHQMPIGRKRVKTWVVPKEKREAAYSWIKKQLKGNHGQTFIICPLIEESETLQTVKAATKEYDTLKKQIFPDLHLALLHGRMKAAEKTKALDTFRSGKVDILVTTPVVEVGIDIPNATIMLIEAADRFGLSQLHQLRGRVGRGVLDSYCLLFTESEDDATIKRLKALETIHNGPELAEVDLKLRGPGELFGTKQHGVPILKFASFRDTGLIREVQSAAGEIFKSDPTLSHFPLLREKLKRDTIVQVSQD